MKAESVLAELLVSISTNGCEPQPPSQADGGVIEFDQVCARELVQGGVAASRLGNWQCHEKYDVF